MPRRYRVATTAAFQRDLGRVRKRAPRAHHALRRALALLRTDPFNLERRANIRKLVNTPAGEGQFRMRLGGYRLRYDVVEDEVVLHSIRPRSRSYR